MKSARRFATALALLAAPASAQPPAERDFDFADLGTTRLVAGGTEGLLLILSDRANTDQARALALAVGAAGRSAAIVDLDSYFARIADGSGDCFDASTLFDVFAQQVQQELRFAHFGSAELAGLGRGAAFVQLLLAGSRSGLFAAGVSAGPPGPLRLPAKPCGELAVQIGWRAADAPLTLPAQLRTSTPFAASADASLASVLNTLDRLRSRDATATDAPGDLPLVELPQAQGGTAPWFALVISGDGGWANIDRDVAEELGTCGIAVLGWNSLRYFWEAKTPERAGADLTRTVQHYTRAWGKPRVLLIGYSLGADVLPFMVNRVPLEVRAEIAGLVLLNPSQTVDFQFHISNWIGNATAAPYALAPEMRKLADVDVLCLYAQDEAADSLCPTLTANARLTVRGLPGDHHFDGDYATLTRTILARFPPSH